MRNNVIESYDNPKRDLEAVLVGRKIVATEFTEAGEDAVLILDNGTRLRVDGHTSDCCSWSNLVSVATCDNIITSVQIEEAMEDVVHTDGKRRDGSAFTWTETLERTRITVITDGGPVEIINSITDPSNGYYLHGWSLDVYVVEA